MKTITATELKANVSAVLGDVERGQSVEITRHGKVIARMEPTAPLRLREIERAMERMEELRRSLPKSGITIDDILKWRHEGHRY